MPTLINSAIFEIAKRSEKKSRNYLVSSFVDVGPLFSLLKTVDNQILYGRRGTGKTHILNYILDDIEKQDNVGIYIDMRNVGSNGGLYSDTSISLSERASRLLIDTFAAIHDQILDFVLLHEDIDLSKISPILDHLNNAIHQIKVVGEVEIASKCETNNYQETSNKFTVSTSPSVSYCGSEKTTNALCSEKQVKGVELHRIHFPTFAGILKDLLFNLSHRTIWIFFDEWAEIPIDLQPYLADLLRRTLFPIPDIIIKIAAIERRTNIKIDNGVSYIGIETGAELSSLNLDEFMVFDNNSNKSKEFFSSLFFNHLKQTFKEKNIGINNKEDFISQAFTQKNAFDELVRAAEGVPRDAINIIILAAMKADQDKISVPYVREAARTWYNRDKEGAISTNKNANLLLRWIIDTVIGERKARAFLLSSDTNSPLIEYLYDARILHIVKTNISAKDTPGERYNVYAIDYGAYVHLINTANAVQGALITDNNEYIEIPMIDYRSVRRAILNIDTFKSKFKK